ncbi:hypothetical protein Hanom_Chr04g00332741 [Helianthus anomalus]
MISLKIKISFISNIQFVLVPKFHFFCSIYRALLQYFFAYSFITLNYLFSNINMLVLSILLSETF